MAGEKPGERGYEVRHAEPGGGAHAQPALQLVAMGTGLGFRGLEFREQGLAAIEVGAAGLGESDATGGGLQKPDAEPCLEAGDGTAHGGNARLQLPGGAHKATLARYFDEHRDLV